MACNLCLGVGQMGLCYLVGVGFYASGFPERSLLGKHWSFDMYANSHALWHVFVVAAAVLHYRSLLELWRSTGHWLAQEGMIAVAAG